jgi:hypothetical protein
MHSITRCTPRLTIEVIALYENTVVAKAPDPDVTFSTAI